MNVRNKIEKKRAGYISPLRCIEMRLSIASKSIHDMLFIYCQILKKRDISTVSNQLHLQVDVNICQKNDLI
ncbi:hypothetical protein DERP_007546 [Dermatophagoides pteronyssinus]|uniref:Uncharacterized protein n=1 Tax=Dermatophagoides pteronyssinus TaxID=6956 RepID=A0ABQ8JKM4_DERPT|nr:hypothetical protein DERP_007546 [Dermatophagoides pteronyssinus]